MNQRYVNYGRNNYQSRNYKLNEEQIKVDTKKIFKDKKDGEDYKEYIKEIERITKNLEISTTKLRKLFEIVESIRDDLKRENSDKDAEKKILEKLLKFRVILEYLKNKEKDHKYYFILKEVVDYVINDPNKKNYKTFVDTMEAIIAFSKNKKGE